MDNYEILYTGKKKPFSPSQEKLFDRYITERYQELVGRRIRRTYAGEQVHLDSVIRIYKRGNDIDIDVATKIMVNGKNKGTQELNFTTTYNDAIAYLVLKLFEEIENAQPYQEL